MTQSSNQQEVDSVSVMVRMTNTINFLKDGTFSDLLSITEKVAKDILEPFMDTNDKKIRQRYGYHLSEIGAPHHLTILLRRLMDVGMETRDGWVRMRVIRSVFLCYADANLKMAGDLGRSGVLKIMLNDLDECGTISSKNEVISKSPLTLRAFSVSILCFYLLSHFKSKDLFRLI